MGGKGLLNHEEIKALLEDTARDSNLKVEGKLAELKTPEQREVDKEIQAWKEEKTQMEDISEFRTPKELINVILTTEHYNGLIFYGEGGIGKTMLTLNEVKHLLKSDEWEYSNGYTTPLALYEFLYHNRNKRVILLDDVEGVFNNALSLAILKGGLWDSNGKRIVQYSSKSDKADTPQAFIMNAKIIILCNSIPKENDISTRAMITRTIPYELRFSFEEKMKICEIFIKKDTLLNKKEQEKVLDLLKTNVSKATKDFNFRTLKKLIAFVKYDEGKAEKLFKETTETDEMVEEYLYAVKQTDSIKAQIEIFIERTGKSRRTFYNVKRKCKDASK